MIISSEDYKKKNEKKSVDEVLFYKKNNSDEIWWVDNKDRVGEHLFTFDKKTIFNLFKDYPYKLTNEEKEMFDKENPYWVNYFKDRSQ